MTQYWLLRDDDDSKPLSDMQSFVMDEEQMEWILNSLRLMQEHQQELAAERNAMDVGEFFQEQYHDVTELREEIVKLVGRDLTDG